MDLLLNAILSQIDKPEFKTQSKIQAQNPKRQIRKKGKAGDNNEKKHLPGSRFRE